MSPYRRRCLSNGPYWGPDLKARTIHLCLLTLTRPHLVASARGAGRQKRCYRGRSAINQPLIGHWGACPGCILIRSSYFFLFPHLILSYLGRTSDDCPVGDRRSAWRRTFGDSVNSCAPARFEIDFIFITLEALKHFFSPVA